jgi:hypothetical protein
LGNYGEQVQMKTPPYLLVMMLSLMENIEERKVRFVYYSKYSELGSDFYTATDNWGTQLNSTKLANGIKNSWRKHYLNQLTFYHWT